MVLEKPCNKVISIINNTRASQWSVLISFNLIMTKAHNLFNHPQVYFLNQPGTKQHRESFLFMETTSGLKLVGEHTPNQQS